MERWIDSQPLPQLERSRVVVAAAAAVEMAMKQRAQQERKVETATLAAVVQVEVVMQRGQLQNDAIAWIWRLWIR